MASDPYAVETQLAAELDQITDAQTRALVAAWALAWSEVSGEVYDVLTDLLQAGGRVTATALRRSQRLTQTLTAIGTKLAEVTAAAGVTITADLDGVVDQATVGQNRLIAAQLRKGERLPGWDASLPDQDQLEAIVQRSTQQITSRLQPVSSDTEDLIRRELIRGVTVGANPRTTARRMVDRAEDHWNFGLTRAMTISRTETLDAYRAGGAAGQRRHAKVLAGWVWLAHLGSRTCRSCLAQHGRLHALEEPGPEDHQQGRCTRAPVVRNADGSPRLDWVPDADEHFDGLSHADQVGILGRKGYQAWLAGEFPRSSWSKRRRAAGWRDSFVPATPGDAGSGSGRNRGVPDTPAGDGAPRAIPVDRDLAYDGTLRRSGLAPVMTYDDLEVRKLLAPDDAPNRDYTDHELKIATWLREHERPNRSVAEARDRRSPDSVLDGLNLPIEFKSLTKAHNSTAVYGAIRSARGQATRAIIDGRGVGLMQADAERGIRRALGQYGLEMDEIVALLADGTSVGWWRGQRL